MWKHIFGKNKKNSIDLLSAKTAQSVVKANLVYLGKCFSYFFTKTYVVGTQMKCLREVLLVSTHKLAFMQKWENYQLFLVDRTPNLEFNNSHRNLSFPTMESDNENTHYWLLYFIIIP